MIKYKWFIIVKDAVVLEQIKSDDRVPLVKRSTIARIGKVNSTCRTNSDEAAAYYKLLGCTILKGYGYYEQPL